jgi:peroxisomal enoyl-CoA hydratase 2
MRVDWENLAVGEERSFEIEDINRTHFVHYAGASGDLNPIHHDQTFAEKAGLPTVFGLGMFTAGALSRVVSEWFGPESIKRYSVRFATRLWPGDTIRCSGRIARVYVDDDLTHADLELSAINQNDETLILGQATVRPWRPSPDEA